MHRMSSRILSMERRGKINLQRYKSIKFCYFANDYLAVRGDGNDFYLCRVLEDVPESKELFSIAWLDRVDTDQQHYMVRSLLFEYNITEKLNFQVSSKCLQLSGESSCLLKQTKEQCNA